MIDEFTLIRSIDDGFTSTVYEASLGGRAFALKKYNASREQFARQQFEIASSLRHPNILRYLDLRTQACYRPQGKPSERCCVIVLEYVEGGQLHELINSHQGLPEEVARTYFHMLVDAVGHMHSLGIYHLDIKPRNILLNGSLQIKLGDFGFSSRNKNSTALLGTVGFAAPEIHSRSIYDCELVDVYACGVVLFASVFGKLPFESSNPKIIMQELFLYERDCFWLMFAEKAVSDELKSLLEWMLSQDCKNRPSIEQLKTHPWFLQDVLMMDEIISLLSPQTKLI